MRILFVILLLFAGFFVNAQSVLPFRADTIKIYKVGGFAELVLQNRTMDSTGILVNMGGGRTAFLKSKKINDSTIVVGRDTLTVGSGTGGGGSGTDTAHQKGTWMVLNRTGNLITFLVDTPSMHAAVPFFSDSTRKYVTPKQLKDSLSQLDSLSIVISNDSIYLCINNVCSFQDTINGVSRASFSASAPLLYNSTTGQFSIDTSAGRTHIPTKADLADTSQTLRALIAAGGSSTLTNTHIFVGNASNVATDVALSGDATIANTGALAIGASKITTAMIQANAVDMATKMTGTMLAAQEPAHTGDATNTAGSLAMTIPANTVTNAKAAQMGANTIKGNNTGGTANAADLTATQVTAMLNTFTTTLQGLVPAPATVTGKVLQDDGTWHAAGAGQTLVQGLRTQIMTDGGQTYIHSNQNINYVDTFYILGSGQSQMGLVVSPIAQSDTVMNPKVQIFDRGGTAAWVTAIPGVSPFTAPSGGNIGIYSAWYLAKKIQAATGKIVRIVNYYHNATTIGNWWGTTTKGPDYDSLLAIATAAAIPRVDLFMWDQGEQDDNTSVDSYTSSWDSLKTNLRRQTWFSQTTPIVVVGMPQVKWGSTTAFTYADRTLRNFDGNQDPWDIYATTDSATVNSGDIHFSNAGKKIIAQNVLNCYNRLPYYPRSSLESVGYLNVIHKDSLPLTSAQTASVILQNTSNHGAVGINMKDSAGTIRWRLVGQNGTTSISGVFRAGFNIISSEGSAGGLSVYQSFAEKLKVTGSGLDIFGATTQTQTTAALFNNYDFIGEDNGHTWLVGGVGSTYNNAPTNQGSFTIYNLSNGPQWNISPIGLMRVGKLVQAGQARMSLDGTLTANNNGTAGMVFSSVKGVVADNNTTGSNFVQHTAIHSFAADTLYFSATAGTATARNASNVYIEGPPIAQTSHTAITAPWALYVDAPTGSSTIRGNLFIKDTINRGSTLQVNGSIWQNKDSLATSSAGSVMTTGIDTITGKYVKFATPASGATNITVTRNALDVTVASSTGSSGTLSVADHTHAGALDSASAALLDSLKSHTAYLGVGATSGTYTATLTNTTNISASTFNQATWTRVGNNVHVTIGGNLTITALLTNSTLTVSLPFTTATTTQIGIGSGAVSPNSGGFLGISGIVQIASGTTARFDFYGSGSSGTGSNFSISFDYVL